MSRSKAKRKTLRYGSVTVAPKPVNIETDESPFEPAKLKLSYWDEIRNEVSDPAAESVHACEHRS